MDPMGFTIFYAEFVCALVQNRGFDPSSGRLSSLFWACTWAVAGATGLPRWCFSTLGKCHLKTKTLEIMVDKGKYH